MTKTMAIFSFRKLNGKLRRPPPTQGAQSDLRSLSCVSLCLSQECSSRLNPYPLVVHTNTSHQGVTQDESLPLICCATLTFV
jgi:hypothetical protein